mgnify:CR=1 FL=1
MTEAIVLTITFSGSGNVNVTGPLQDKILCYGMLERAKDAIRDYKPESQQLVIPQMIPPKNGY